MEKFDADQAKKILELEDLYKSKLTVEYDKVGKFSSMAPNPINFPWIKTGSEQLRNSIIYLNFTRKKILK